MRSLTTVLCGLTLLVALGCPKNEEKPVPVNTTGGGNTPPPVETGTNPAGAESTEPGGVNEAEAEMAVDTAKTDEAFRASLQNLKEAMDQDIALAVEVKAQEAAALQSLGGALETEVEKREAQELQIAHAIIEGLKQKGFKVWANVIDIDKPLPEAAAAILDPLKIGDTSRVIEWENGLGLIRKMSENDTRVKFGYIYATKDAAMAPASMDNQPVVADGTTTSGDGGTTTAPAGE